VTGRQDADGVHPSAVGQSGTMGAAITDRARDDGLSVGTNVSVRGGSADVTAIKRQVPWPAPDRP